MVKKIIIYQGHWTNESPRENKNALYIFGDNDIKQGNGGQAVIRDEPNAMGVPTKKLPSKGENSFYTDLEYDSNIQKINIAIENILKEFMKDDYNYLVLSYNKLGTGLSQLPERAPKTFKYLDNKINNLIQLFD
jgi:hypothetical protein